MTDLLLLMIVFQLGLIFLIIASAIVYVIITTIKAEAAQPKGVPIDLREFLANQQGDAPSKETKGGQNYL